MIDEKTFFDTIRGTSMFGGRISPAAVIGIKAILDGWGRRKLTDLRYLAYMLATVRGECGRDMSPVREGYSASDTQARLYVGKKGYTYAAPVDGQVYYGRGFVQLTWVANYRAMGSLLGVDLVKAPDRALEPAIATDILFEGMLRGTFTGQKLAQFFTDTGSDWIGARKIINGTDRADEFATYGRSFFAALTSAASASAQAPYRDGNKVPPPPDIPKPLPTPAPAKGFWGKFADLFKPKGT